jgi:hypothetical protein
MGADEVQELRVGDRRNIELKSADLDRPRFRGDLALAGAELEKRQKVADGEAALEHIAQTILTS